MPEPIFCAPHHEVYATNGIDTATGRRDSVVLVIDDTTGDHASDAVAILTPSEAKALAIQLLEATDEVTGP